jgi:LPPG:FO 2-phospho-L-lactate transferase
VVVALAGGVGAARFLRGLVDVVDARQVTAVVNTGDDIVLHGLHVSPDLDTVLYTLAGAVNPLTGWGLLDETWQVMAALERYPAVTWFRLGDRDLATHMFRSQRLAEGASLSQATSEIAAAWGVQPRLVPMSDSRVETRVLVAEGEIGFQEYFVQRRHAVPVKDVRFAGSAAARPAPGVLAAVAAADAIVICPSNPIVSIGPVLAVPGVVEALESRRDRTVAISPIVAGAALKGPADRMMAELGHEPSVVGVARMYASFASVLVVDEADAARAPEVDAVGIRCVVAPAIMRTPTHAAVLARAALDAVASAPAG